MIYHNYKIGDVLRCEKGLGTTHVGIVVGPNSVFHNSPGYGEHISSLADFAKGRAIAVQPTQSNPNLVLDRVRRRLASPQKYSAITSNCEHSVSAVLNGNEVSPQLVSLGVLAAIGAFAYIISR